MDLNKYLTQLTEKKDLNRAQARDLVSKITGPEASELFIAAILTALRTKGESAEEITGFIDGMRERMISVPAPAGAVDIVGTGGDGARTFNISTAAAFVLAGAGAIVAKHGNRSASSRCGSADVLENLGVNINLAPEKAEKVLKKLGMVFLFAPVYHPAMKKVGPVRRELGIRTIFNYLGPFLNPANVKRALIGVPNREIAFTLSEVAKFLNYQHLLIVTSGDGLDEMTTSANTLVFEVRGRKIREFEVTPGEFNFPRAEIEDLKGGDIKDNAMILKSILSGEAGAKRDTVLLNAAFGLYVAGNAPDLIRGVELAKTSIDNGEAMQVLDALIRETNT